MDKLVELGSLISAAKPVRCGTGKYPVLSMTMHDGLVFQDEKFKKVIASKDTSDYKVVYRNQLVISFPIDEGVLATQRIADAGIVSPAYGIWDVDQSQIHPEFLEYALRSNRALQYYKAKLRGSTARRRSLPTPTLLAFTIPLPSLEEQKAILDYIARAKSIIEKRKAQIFELNELIKARFVEMFGDPNINEKQWEKGKINDVGTCVAGATPSTNVNEYWEGGTIPWMSSGEVNKGRIYETDSFITQLGYDNASTKMVPAKTVVLAMAGQGKTRGTAAITEIELCTNQSICSIVNNDRVNPEYLLFFLKLQYKELRGASTNTDGRGGLNLKIIGNYSIMIPPIDLQNNFAEFVKQVDKSKSVVQKSLDEARILYDSLMQQYFG